MRKPLLSRRAVLRGACGATITLPFLEAMGWGQVGAPKRIFLIATMSGTALGHWVPVHDGARDPLGRVSAKITKMSDMLAPLDPWKEKIIQLRGAHLYSAESRDDGHTPGKRVLFSNFRPAGGTGGPPAGITVDQAVANKLTGSTKVKSVDMGVPGGGGGGYGEFFALGPGKQLRPANSAKAVFDLLFKNLKIDPNDPAVLLAKARHQSMLDTVKANYGRLLARRLGKEDQARVQSHLESIRELERSLNFTVTGACSGPDISGAADKTTNGAPYWATLDAHYDIIEKAFACDLTRVATLEIGLADGAGLPCKFGGTGIVNGSHHNDYSHGGQDGPEMATIQNAYAGHLARFLGKLDAIKEGDGTALDNTIIAWSSEVNAGGNHTFDNSPFLLVGSAGGYFKTGRFIDFCTPDERAKNQMTGYHGAVTPGLFGGIGHGRVLVSLLNSMGVEAQTFGNPAFSQGPAPLLT